MKKRLVDFWYNDTGVVTINWLILGAGFVVVSGAVLWVIAPSYNLRVDSNMDLLCDVAKDETENTEVCADHND